MINPVTFTGDRPGPCLLVFGRIHGNEPSGTLAQEAVIDRIKRGALTLSSGTVIFVPVCNPRAMEIDRRFVDIDLNRNFRLVDPPKAYEHQLVHELAPLIRQADHVLDIHSTASETEPFLFVDVWDTETDRFATALDVPNIVTGWAEVYDETSDDADTMSMVTALGKTGVVLETGQHGDPNGPEVAERAILNALSFLGLTGPEARPAEQGVYPRMFRMERLERKPHDGATFERPLQNFSPVQKDELIARWPGADPLRAPFDGFVLLPKAHAKAGGEWFYFARTLSDARQAGAHHKTKVPDQNQKDPAQKVASASA